MKWLYCVSATAALCFAGGSGQAQELPLVETPLVNRWDRVEARLPPEEIPTDWRNVPKLHAEVQLVFPVGPLPKLRREEYAVVPESLVNAERPTELFVRKRERSHYRAHKIVRAGTVFL